MPIELMCQCQPKLVHRTRTQQLPSDSSMFYRSRVQITRWRNINHSLAVLLYKLQSTRITAKAMSNNTLQCGLIMHYPSDFISWIWGSESKHWPAWMARVPKTQSFNDLICRWLESHLLVYSCTIQRTQFFTGRIITGNFLEVTSFSSHRDSWEGWHVISETQMTPLHCSHQASGMHMLDKWKIHACVCNHDRRKSTIHSQHCSPGSLHSRPVVIYSYKTGEQRRGLPPWAFICGTFDKRSYSSFCLSFPKRWTCFTIVAIVTFRDIVFYDNDLITSPGLEYIQYAPRTRPLSQQPG